MGYTKIVQYGLYTEVLTYEKNVSQKKRTYRKRVKRKAGATMHRTLASVRRAKTNFYHIVQAQLSTEGPPTFLTLTYIQEQSLTVGYRDIRKFFQILERYTGRLQYIAVPEWQKNGNLHFHALLWRLPIRYVQHERNTRFLQRCWARGFLDVLSAKNSSSAIAGYLTKYMSKTYSDSRLNNKRAYTHSNNIQKKYTYGSNHAYYHLQDVIPDDVDIVHKAEYDTPYLGNCNKVIYKKHAK